MHRSILRALACVSLLVLTFAAAAAQSSAAPVLTVETDDGLHRLYVEFDAGDGTLSRTLLRETTSSVRPGTTGGDPAGLAMFATWTENGAQPWSAWSRDAGTTWSEARPTDDRLRLLAGAVGAGQAIPRPANGLALPAGGRVHLVQFRTVSLPEWRDALEAAGVEIVGFFPHNAHLVRMPASLRGAVEELDFVRRVEPFHPSYRIEPELTDWIGGAGIDRAVFDADGRVRLNVMAFEWGPAGKSRIATFAENLGADVARYFPSGRILELWVPRDAIATLAAHDDVSWIDRWSEPETDMDGGADWLETNFGYCGDGVRGEVMDSGVQSNHPDFDGILHHGNWDTSSHGTSTYGIVFGNGARDGDGDATATGFMPCEGAQGIFADYGFLGDRFAHTEELKNDPYFASFQTNSWGNARTTAYTSVSSEMDDIIFRLDIAITQSQSNAGNQNSRPQAWAKNIVSVGAIRHRNTLDESDDAWSSGASIGPAADGRLKPDVHYWYDDIRTTTTGSGYTNTFGGTSGATPQVAGILGLMLQMWADDVWGTDPQGATVFEKQPHHTTIKALLVNNAKQYTFTGTTSDLTRTHQGWGRPNVQIAHERAANSFVVDWDQVLTVGQTASYDINVPAGETELKITMIYPDPPGTTSSTLHRINDVDLRVVAPDGTEYFGNVGLDAGNYSVPGGAPNGVDTVENVFVESPASGVWTVEVSAAEVNVDGYLETAGDDVVFSLVVTGGTGGAVCGNGVREFGEQCDGSDLGGVTCEARGCTGGGTLGCTTSCTFDTSQCTGCPVCGDGNCDFGEDCIGCSADCISEPANACGNGVCEAADGEDCLTCPADCNGVQNGKPANRYCCGGGGGENPVPCDDGRCTQGNDCQTGPALAYCCGDGGCSGAETQENCAVDCTPPSPGEAGDPALGMMMLSYDRLSDVITVDYGAACSAEDHALVFGELSRANLETYAWSGRECAVGVSGTYDWDQTGTPASTFFVLVGTTTTSEGSYGTDSNLSERPEDEGVAATCQVPQDLVFRCD
jgi:hypothetical protein